MTSSESEELSRAKKRVRTGSKSEVNGYGVTKEGKKARGRPRVDTQDATAADRRRTQIRLAQRAYRQRKETTIASLKQQTAQLQSIIEQMNSTFVRFSEAALKSGVVQLNPNVAQELRLSNETFNTLARKATEIESTEDDFVDPTEPTLQDMTPPQPQVPSPPHEEPQTIGWGYMSARNDHQRIQSPSHISTHTENEFLGLGPNSISTDHASTSIIPRPQYTMDALLDSRRPSQQQMSQSQQPQLPFGFIDMLSHHQAPGTPSHPHVFSVNVPTPNVTPPMARLPTPPSSLQNPSSIKTLAPIATYSYDESTFSRRLHRGALEAGVALLSAAQSRPAALNYVYKLSLPYLSVEELCARFRLMLARGVNEDLDFWETPFIHLGGAGTHYARKDIHGNIIKKKNGWTVRRIGPVERHMVRVQNVDDGRWEDIDGIDLSGFEGEWFDANDVQGFIEEQWHCQLDPMKSFTQCLVEELDRPLSNTKSTWTPPQTLFPQAEHVRRVSDESLDSPSLTNSSSTSSSTHSTTPPAYPTYSLPEAPFNVSMSFTSPSLTAPTDFGKYNSNVDLSFDQTLGLDLAPGFDYGFSVDSNFQPSMDLGLDLMGQGSVIKQKRTKSAWLDTNQLIDELLKHAICLGRAPGFRRKDVEFAVRKSLVSAL